MKTLSKLLAFLLSFSLLLSAIAVQVGATEETSYVSSVAYGNRMGGDSGVDVAWNTEKGQYDVALPDNRVANIQIWVYGDDTKGWKDVHGGVEPRRGSPMNTKVTLQRYIKPDVLPVGSTYDFFLKVGSMTSNYSEFTEEPQIVNIHHSVKLVLTEMTVDGTMSPAFDPYTMAYMVSLEEGQETVTVNATPFTALASEDISGAVIQYLNTERQAINPIEGNENEFAINMLPMDEDGNPYLIVNVSYSDTSKETVSSDYMMVFVDPSQLIPHVMVEQTEVELEKDSTIPLAVSSDIEGCTYQWYGNILQSSAEEYQGQSIAGATENTYLPDTSYAHTWYYWCDVTNTVAGVSFTSHSPVIKTTVLLTYVNPPVISEQPQDTEGSAGSKQVFYIAASCSDIGTQLSFQWYQVSDLNYSDPIPLEISNGGSDSFFYPDTTNIGTYYYYCEVTASGIGMSASKRSSIATLILTDIPGTEALDGSGRSDDPYLINSIEDLQTLKSIVENGYGLEGKFMRMTDDLTLPSDWEPIGNLKDGLEDDPVNYGNGANVNPFMGTFDGGGHLLTIAEGGRGLFKFVRDATIRNMDVFGADIQGSALVTKSFTDYGTSGVYQAGTEHFTVNIDHVTMKSGSHASKSGFLLGSGSGVNTVTIKNSLIEEGVVIGSEGMGGNGSFVSSLNGYIENCVSYATVYGYGGLAGQKGETMGYCEIKNSAFLGTLISSSYAGGIIGLGYGIGEYEQGLNSAPQTPPVSIQNCYVKADITGKGMVGGILGGEPDLEAAINNAYITDNYFYGQLNVTDSESYVGGIIGYLGGYDNMQHYQNNYWLGNCGAERGIGYINHIVMPDEPTFGQYAVLETVDDAYIDRICTATTATAFADGTVTAALNTSETSLKNWVQGDDYPIHGDGAVAEKLLLTGSFKTDYVIGDELNMTGASFTVRYSDGTETPVTLEEITFSGFDSATRGFKTVTAAYGPVSVDFDVCVLYPDDGQTTIRVLLSMWGDSQHRSDLDGNVHTMADRNLELWIAPTVYEVGPNATVLELLEEAMTANNMTWVNPDLNGGNHGNYIEAVTYGNTTIGEFTNGDASGWMYFYNGIVSLNGVSEQFLEDGDEIVFRYTDDYNREKGNSEMGGADNVSFRSVTAAGSTAAPSITFNAEGYSVMSVTVGSSTITLTDTAEEDTFIISSTNDAPGVVLVKDAEGNYTRRTVTTEDGVHKVVIGAGESVVVGILGDANGDGKLTAADCSKIMSVALNKEGASYPSEFNCLLADLNGDGKTSAADCAKITAIALGRIQVTW